MTSKQIPQFLIAAPSSSSGKTTVTLGLIKALYDRGLRVQSFKCGPDYIDPILHSKTSTVPCINLDTFMCSDNHVKNLYAHYSEKSDVNVVEGVMGLFDGADKMKGSSAEIASLLGLPVIFVVNAKAMAYSAAALIYGYKNFNPDINLLGVIFNHVSTESHYSFLKDACRDAGVEALGYLPPQKHIEIPGRHLGLSIASDIDLATICTNIAVSLEETVNIDSLLNLTSQPRSLPNGLKVSLESAKRVYKIAVARDDAFSFTYYENLEALKRMGEVIFFSPLKDEMMPACDLLYLAGGYPELFLEELSSNTSMLKSVYTFCSNHGKTYAECGGMMYLGKSITDKDGKVFKMTGFLPISTSMEYPKLHLGYRMVMLDELIIKGHEFHYSISHEEEYIGTEICTVKNAKGMAVDSKMYKKASTLATYIHLYWGENHAFLHKILEIC